MGLESSVAGRYATALFELAKENNQVDRVSGELSDFAALVKESPEMDKFVRSPVISSEDKLAALTAVLDKTGFTTETSGFLKVLARNNRLGIVTSAIKAFEQMLSEDRNEISATITSAQPLDQTQQQSLRESLKKKFNKDVQMDLHVDPELLGGVIIRVGSQMIDNSLRTKLKTLEISMKEVG